MLHLDRTGTPLPGRDRPHRGLKPLNTTGRFLQNRLSSVAGYVRGRRPLRARPGPARASAAVHQHGEPPARPRVPARRPQFRRISSSSACPIRGRSGPQLERVKHVREALPGWHGAQRGRRRRPRRCSPEARAAGCATSPPDAAPIVVGATGADRVLGPCSPIAEAMRDGHWQRMKRVARALPVGLLRPLAQPHGHLVLDAHLRQPQQGARHRARKRARRDDAVLALAARPPAAATRAAGC